MSSTTFPPVEEQLNLLTRGAAEVYSRDDLAKRLKHSFDKSKPLRVKLGLDPTRPDIHVGHSVVLKKLRQFQDLGHQAVLIVGDFTAMVGDPSGRSKTRPALTREEIDAAAATYIDQVSAILDVSKLEVRRNGEWFSRMGFDDVMRLAGRITVARLLERDDFSKRFRENAPISLHEFFYPVMQGHDSVEISSDIELGGTDQTFNLLMGRRMQEEAGLAPQICITMPLLPGTDGSEKMSKSLDNAIGVRDEPNQMFGRAMSIPDALMKTWFSLLTDLPSEDIDRLCDANLVSPRETKDLLAQAIVSQYYGRETAEAASAEFTRRFREHRLPDDIPDFRPASLPAPLAALLVEASLAGTNSEARRLIQQGGVRLIQAGSESSDGEVLSDPTSPMDLPVGSVLRVGKRRFVRIVQ